MNLDRDKSITIALVKGQILSTLFEEGCLKDCLTVSHLPTLRRVRLACTLYSLFHTPWRDVSINFVLGLPKSVYDSISVFMNRFSMMAHFILCSEIIYASYVFRLIFRDDLKLYDLPPSL